ncbi:DUF1456 family protein [Flavobacterium sp.]|uniref:DUF1456 family protein n=1 Tax=Flavobacterium sp. TaxID=239 RepID=UPI00121E64A0|nr:DUF1456 family protein [Flavobacterium sp.]RZJ69658.1 MAG: DUF1456 family protein [Flavobacterium sp.]
MNNNDIFKKLRVALQLRDDQIVEILELVDFRISKGEVGNFFRNEDHEKFVSCGDQVLRNFLNALVIHLRGTKENPKNPTEVLGQIKAQVKAPAKNFTAKDAPAKNASAKRPAKNFTGAKPFAAKKTTKSPVENVKYTIKKKK